MRGVFVRELISIAGKDPRIVLLTGDLGFMVLEPFIQEFPKRFFNVGAAEQNMVGLATGLAEAGFIPFVYSIATFACLRPYEFIRNGPILHRLPVRIIAVGDGFAYGPAGTTHHALEDIALMRVQPGITLISPADHQQARNALRKTWNLPGPVYYRLGKDDKTVVAGLEGRFRLGKTELCRRGKDLLFVTVGSIASEVAAACEVLAKKGIQSSVLVISSLNPVEKTGLSKHLSGFRLVLTVEEHYLNGGIGSLISEVVAQESLKCRVIRCAVKNIQGGLTGSCNYLRRINNLSSEYFVKTAIKALNKI